MPHQPPPTSDTTPPAADALDQLAALRDALALIERHRDPAARTPATDEPNTAATRTQRRAAFGATFAPRDRPR